jgi:hypothetical protein
MKKIAAALMVLLLAGCYAHEIDPVPSAEPNWGVSKVQLEGGNEIQPRLGRFGSYAGPGFARNESQVTGLEAQLSVSNRKPKFLVSALDEAQVHRIYLVKLEGEPKDFSRHVKLDGWTTEGQPDNDWRLRLTFTKREDGTWELQPGDDLPDGQYALWKARGLKKPRPSERVAYYSGVFYEFGVRN